MYTYKDIANEYGISERIEALEKALLSIDGVEKVDFDLNGYLDDIHQVIIIPKYSVTPVDWKSDSYYEKRDHILDSILKAAEKEGLSRTEDRIEDMGEHYYIVFSSRNWRKDKAAIK